MMTMPQRIQSLIAVGRILTIFATLRKNDYDYGNTGSKVREYAATFAQTNGISGRTHSSRSNAVRIDSGDDGPDEFDA